MLTIGKKLSVEQRLQKAVVDIMANPKYIALAGLLMIGEREVVDMADGKLKIPITGIPTATAGAITPPGEI